MLRPSKQPIVPVSAGGQLARWPPGVRKEEYRCHPGVLKMSSRCPQGVLKVSSRCPQGVFQVSSIWTGGWKLVRCSSVLVPKVSHRWPVVPPSVLQLDRWTPASKVLSRCPQIVLKVSSNCPPGDLQLSSR